MRRTLIILVVLLNATAPTFAGTCASHCASSGMSSHSADSPVSDCHDAVPVDGQDHGVPAGGDDSGDDGLMQAACAVAGAVALTPEIVALAPISPVDAAAAASAAFASRITVPPDHPPRASSI
jgi:hypothetical protein